MAKQWGKRHLDLIRKCVTFVGTSLCSNWTQEQLVVLWTMLELNILKTVQVKLQFKPLHHKSLKRCRIVA